MSLDYLFTILNDLTWGFRIEKFQERDSDAVYHVWYVNPADKVWYCKDSDDIREATKEAVIHLLRTKPRPSPSNGLNPPELYSGDYEYTK